MTTKRVIFEYLSNVFDLWEDCGLFEAKVWDYSIKIEYSKNKGWKYSLYNDNRYPTKRHIRSNTGYIIHFESAVIESLDVLHKYTGEIYSYRLGANRCPKSQHRVIEFCNKYGLVFDTPNNFKSNCCDNPFNHEEQLLFNLKHLYCKVSNKRVNKAA